MTPEALAGGFTVASAGSAEAAAFRPRALILDRVSK